MIDPVVRQTTYTIDETAIDDAIKRALDEDIADGDVTTLTTVTPNTMMTGTFVAKARGVVAGLTVVTRTFTHLDKRIRVEPLVADGDCVQPQQTIAKVYGPAQALLSGERVALNLLQRGLSAKVVAEDTGLSIEEVQQLQQQIAK